MKKLTAFALALLFAASASAQITGGDRRSLANRLATLESGAITPGVTGIAGCTNQFVIADGSSLINCAFVASAAGSSITSPMALGTANGADMVTNGTFTGNANGWTLGLGGGTPDWFYNSNNVSHANGGGTATLEPSTPLTVVAGRTYRVTFTLSGVTAGTVTASIGAASGAVASTSGTYVQPILATGTTNLKFTPSTTFVGTIDTISVTESASVTVANLTLGRIPITKAGGRLTDSASFLADDAGGGDGIFTVLKTPSGGGITSNFLKVTGTQPTTLTSSFAGFLVNVTSAGSSSQITTAQATFFNPGYTGTSPSVSQYVSHQVAGTGTWSAAGSLAGNVGAFNSSIATTTGHNFGNFNYANGGNLNVGSYGAAATAKDSAINGGVVGLGSNTGATPIAFGGYFGLNATAPTFITAGLVTDNSSIAAPVLVARDNGAALPTTGATATWQIADGAWPQVGNGVLTNATMTPEVQGRECGGGLCHSYLWTTAMVNTALGAGTTGDVTVATLPAKTQLTNAYVVITEAAAGPNTLTVSCGDANDGTPFIGYVVPSDAKAGVSTVYGDAVGERGASIDTEFYYLPSYTATKVVTCHFIAGNTTDLTTGQGKVILQTALLP